MPSVSEIYGQPWREREYIIVLDSYFKNRDVPCHVDSEYIRDLASLLGRTPASILMRFQNFASLDPERCESRVGLPNIGPVGIRIFNDWLEKQDQLRDVAEVLVREQSSRALPTLFEPEPVRIPKAFGRYELGDCIGEGGFGVVFDCVDIKTGLPYAIKIIRTDRLADREALHRFRQEIRGLRKLDHANIIPMYEDNLDSQKEFPAFVMDLGKCSLAQHLDETQGRPIAQTRKIMKSMFAAITTMHNGSLIHRDINPNNILLMPSGSWVLADFGLIGFMQTMPPDTSYRSATMGWGTSFYAAPEQYSCFKEADKRSDIYALGMLMWRLFSSEVGIPDREDHGLPDELAFVFLRAAHRKKELRYESAIEFENAFDKALQEDGLSDGG